MAMKTYMTLFYTIKRGDLGFFCYIIQEFIMIFQVPAANKPEYTRVMLQQLHIFNIKTFDLQLQNVYLANTLINLCGLPHMFSKIDLLLKHQNEKFKYF